MKRILTMILAVTMLSSFAGCAKKTDAGESPSSSASSAPSTVAPAVAEEAADVFAARFSEMLAGTGEFEKNPVAEIETSEGMVKVRLFPTEAPKAVENFVTHAKAGYYDGLGFHRVIDGFMIQGGDPEGNGSGGESIWGEPFEDEFTDYMHNFRGALSMANSGPATNGSQFFIVQSDTAYASSQIESQTPLNMYMNRELFRAQQQLMAMQLAGKSMDEQNAFIEDINTQLTEKQKAGAPKEFVDKLAPVLEKYKKEGGTPYLDYKHTVFGYVIEGLDVVDKIAALDSGETDAQGNQLGNPSKPVSIVKITIKE